MPRWRAPPPSLYRRLQNPHFKLSSYTYVSRFSLAYWIYLEPGYASCVLQASLYPPQHDNWASTSPQHHFYLHYKRLHIAKLVLLNSGNNRIIVHYEDHSEYASGLFSWIISEWIFCNIVSFVYNEMQSVTRDLWSSTAMYHVDESSDKLYLHT